MNNKKKTDILTEYCTGCGLCASVLGREFKTDSKGFEYPVLKEEDAELLSAVCPAGGNSLNNYADGSIWGKMHYSKLGWASDNGVRFAASSGGVLTSLAKYLLDKGEVNGIIQTRKSSNDIRLTETIVSRTVDEVLSCSGSRYTSSSPLRQIKQMVKPGEKYAFVGKPCDVSALRMYINVSKEEWTSQIVYLFSFFCAGQPSISANNKLISSLGAKLEDCADLQYRGNGWPGFAKVVLKDSTERTMEYEKSWMTILGRDVRRSCRFCADGTGEMADISCGDAWHLTPEGKPDFRETDGRNVIFVRTDSGKDLFERALADNYVVANDFNIETDRLAKRQPYHYVRKASLSSLKIAMTVCGRNFPMYGRKKLAMFAKDLPLSSKIYRCLGTIQRVWKKKL